MSSAMVEFEWCGDYVMELWHVEDFSATVLLECRCDSS
jgi:hypothetical protein